MRANVLHLLLRSSKRTQLVEGNCISPSVMSTEDYLEVVELYTIQLLGIVLYKHELAISWTERAELPESNRQGGNQTCLISIENAGLCLAAGIFRPDEPTGFCSTAALCAARKQMIC